MDDLLISVQKARREVFHQLLGVEVEEVAKGLDGDDGAGDGILLRHSLLKKELQGFPGAATQIGKKIPVIEKVPAQDLRDAEDEMPVGNLPEYVGTEPCPEFLLGL